MFGQFARGSQKINIFRTDTQENAHCQLVDGTRSVENQLGLFEITSKIFHPTQRAQKLGGDVLRFPLHPLMNQVHAGPANVLLKG